MSKTPHYDRLPAANRLAIERMLYERVFGGPFTARTLPKASGPAQEEHLAAWIREAIQQGNNGAWLSRGALEATRELTAQSAGQGPPRALRTPRDLRQAWVSRLALLKAAGRFPYDLDPDLAFEKDDNIPLVDIAAKRLHKVGYRLVSARSDEFRAGFDKALPDGSVVSCDLDFGRWRRTVMAMWTYSRGEVRIALPLDYSPSSEPAPIIDRELFEQTVKNIVFTIAELELELGEDAATAAA